MSRIGKKPVVLGKGVTAKIDAGSLQVKGPKGELSLDVREERYRAIDIKIADEAISVTRREESRRARTEQGLVRALIQNMVTGVTEQFTKGLDIVGVGYKAEVKGTSLNLNLGYSHPIEYVIPEGITIAVEKQTRVSISGADRQLVGETAAQIRRFRPPEPYKGKGILYTGEIIRRKVGKAAAGSSGG